MPPSGRDLQRIFSGSLVALALCAGASSAMDPSSVPFRSPQVPVHGSALEDWLRSIGESIDVRREQRDVELLARSYPTAVPWFQVELVRVEPGVTAGIYDGHAATPTPIPIFTPTMPAGSFAVVSFRSIPPRVRINVFEPVNATLVESRDVPGVVATGIGFYVQNAEGTFFSQDDRNASAEPRCLYFVSQLAYSPTSAALAMACEGGAVGGGATADFADVLLWLDFSGGDTPSNVTSVSRTTWGALKSRFRAGAQPVGPVPPVRSTSLQ